MINCYRENASRFSWICHLTIFVYASLTEFDTRLVSESYNPLGRNMIGESISGYHIQARLGSGVLGSVYMAQDTRNERTVTLKIIDSEVGIDPDTRTRFEALIRLTCELNHPNVCVIREVGETSDGRFFIVQDQDEGETLKARIQRSPLSLNETLDIARQVTEGLIQLHDRGLVHGDIKPANIFLTVTGLVKILDIGMAHLLAKAPQRGADTDLSSIAYLSPEQIDGKKYNVHADVWSLGTLLHEMVTGDRPFSGDSYQTLSRAILSEVSEPATNLRAGVSQELHDVIDRCLEKSQHLRYQNCIDLLADLNRAEAKLTGTARLVAPQKPIITKKKRVVRAATIAVGSVFVLLVALVGLDVGGLRERLTGRGTPDRITSIAVMPFQNTMNDPDQEYLVDGLHSELISELSRLGEIEVISHASAMKYEDSDKTKAEIARELGVDAVVEGAFLPAEGKIRLSAQMVGKKSDAPLWTETYDRSRREVPALPGQMALAIVNQMDVSLTPTAQTRLATKQAVDPEAHDAYLRGLHLRHEFRPEATAEARKYLQSAIALDPAYAPAHVGLGWTFTGWPGAFEQISPRESYAQARSAATRALELDASLPDAHLLMGDIYFEHDWNWQAAEAAYRRAVELGPGLAPAHGVLGEFLSVMGRHDEAIAQLQRAVDLDPAGVMTRAQLGFALYRAGRYEDARRQLQAARNSDPANAYPHAGLGRVHLQMGRYDDALQAFAKVEELIGVQPVHFRLCVYALTGRETEVRQTLDHIEADPAAWPGFQSVQIAQVYAALGDKDRAFYWLEKAYEERLGLPGLQTDPLFASLRDDARYANLAAKLGLAR